MIMDRGPVSPVPLTTLLPQLRQHFLPEPTKQFWTKDQEWICDKLGDRHIF
jgi:hypothetical protein